MSNGSIKIGGVTLTRGNTKLGRVLNLSLPPPKTCDHSLPCYKGGCYALRSCYNLYPEVRKAWDGNWRAWKKHGLGFFESVHEAVAKVRPELFRWHVGGDIPDADYLYGMLGLARLHPETRFRAFTKKYDIVKAQARDIRKHKNLTVSLSMWPGLKCHPATIRAWSTSWVRDHKNPDPRIPETAKECSGKCDTCQLCWGLKPGESVVFDKH